ncbi:unnamed protein product [Phytophthora lilii]|uniref:Unnamed protein product n=1 Tax=Phytophthora lilii TaxID=2077276 RepID=A0A9W6XQN5_9STRA|nr:unnamed protein product [Phytophthora lilii]
MPFGLKNAPQIYQRLLDNALYGFTRISRSGSNEDLADLDPCAFNSGRRISRNHHQFLGNHSMLGSGSQQLVSASTPGSQLQIWEPSQPTRSGITAPGLSIFEPSHFCDHSMRSELRHGELGLRPSP